MNLKRLILVVLFLAILGGTYYYVEGYTDRNQESYSGDFVDFSPEGKGSKILFGTLVFIVLGVFICGVFVFFVWHRLDRRRALASLKDIEITGKRSAEITKADKMVTK